MPLLDIYCEIREKFPIITEKADLEHVRNWGDIDPDFAYSWFESLANALNNEMTRNVSPKKYEDIFRYLSISFSNGDKEVRNCIDAAFTENLFWKVEAVKAKPYWELLPNNLKDLYVSFHRKNPL
ncbi:Uncharacterized protein dnl_32810 [Desulfonema limicola]|uniref:DUF7674 domain-containing protein n=1 Tax=Desulfonema limicola TaxID=45656 RepID=A0A975B905_9BACT|nr:hypothetical protein [Desulfonema limicola]QTA80964.1 Uncharacterized protein dnl_32810 [Desulfonema limicola]